MPHTIMSSLPILSQLSAGLKRARLSTARIWQRWEVGDDEIILLGDDSHPPAESPTIPLFTDLPKKAFIQLMEQMSMRTVLPD